jgi:hypothetical protein
VKLHGFIRHPPPAGRRRTKAGLPRRLVRRSLGEDGSFNEGGRICFTFADDLQYNSKKGGSTTLTLLSRLLFKFIYQPKTIAS